MEWYHILFIILTIVFIYYWYKNRSQNFNDFEKDLNENKNCNSKYPLYFKKIKKKIQNKELQQKVPNQILRILDDPNITENNIIEAEKLLHEFNIEVFNEPKNGIFVVEFQENNNNNAHDNNVNRDFDEQYAKLAIEVKDQYAPDLIDYLSSLGDHKVNVFLKTVLHNFYLYRESGYEIEIYYNIWKRIHMFDGQIKETMKEAFLEQIKDCFPNPNDDYIHCVNGRITRLFSSLATLDNKFGVLKTNDMIKKEALEKASFIYEDTINKYIDDVDFGEAARSHREVISNPKNESEFNEILTKKMKDFINEDYGHINPLLKENLLASIIEPFN